MAKCMIDFSVFVSFLLRKLTNILSMNTKIWSVLEKFTKLSKKFLLWSWFE